MRQHVRTLAAALVMAVLLLGTTDMAQGGDRDHLNGFFMRLSAGGGTAKTEFELGTNTLELSGPAGDINFAFGGIVAPNIALHATLFGWTISEPDAEFGGEEGQVPADLAMAAVGVGLTYYFMPANLYVSGSVGAGRLRLDSKGGDAETDIGTAVDVTVGKEWWVGRRWALGIAGAFGYHSVPEKNIKENWTGSNFAVRFSATMN